MSEHLSLGLPTLTRRLHWQHFAAGAGLGAGGHARAAPRLRALSDLALSLAPLSERQFLCYRGLWAHFAPSSVSLPEFQGVCSKLVLVDLLRLGLSPPLRKRLRLVVIGGHLARPPSRTGAVPWAHASTGGQADTAFTRCCLPARSKCCGNRCCCFRHQGMSHFCARAQRRFGISSPCPQRFGAPTAGTLSLQQAATINLHAD